MKTIKLGSIGEDVELLQNLLIGYCYNVNNNGIFDTATNNAVIKFQLSKGLGADVIVGFKSWDALLFSNHVPQVHLTESDFEKIALLLNVEKACIKAVQQVETGGKGGFFAPGKPAILFEGHIFWNQLKKRGINPRDYIVGNEDIIYSEWEMSFYKGGLKEYDRLERARKINRDAADASASWGMFQIMGFNYFACGEKSIRSFVDAMCESELRQLRLSATFMYREGMIPFLQQKDWPEFAKRYNGAEYTINKYDKKLKEAYERFL